MYPNWYPKNKKREKRKEHESKETKCIGHDTQWLRPFALNFQPNEITEWKIYLNMFKNSWVIFLKFLALLSVGLNKKIPSILA